MLTNDGAGEKENNFSVRISEAPRKAYIFIIVIISYVNFLKPTVLIQKVPIYFKLTLKEIFFW